MLTLVLASFIIVVTPARIFQYLYDRAKELSETSWGWLALGIAMCERSNPRTLGIWHHSCTIGIISVPPLVGHTTLTSLCGFAYGMKGFFISALASLVGSAGAFIMLRCLLSERIRQWSAHNDKWQALEAVVVSPHTISPITSNAESTPSRKPKVFLWLSLFEYRRSHLGSIRIHSLLWVSL